MASNLFNVLGDVVEERLRQDEKWGEQNHPDGTAQPGSKETADDMRDLCNANAKAGVLTWTDILDEEIAEAYAETDTKLRTELVQTAAVVVAWIEAIDRRAGSTG